MPSELGSPDSRSRTNTSSNSSSSSLARCALSVSVLSHRTLEVAYDFVKRILGQTKVLCQSILNNLPRNFDHVVSSVFRRDVAIATEELRVRMRSVVVQDFLASLDWSQSGNSQGFLFVVYMRLSRPLVCLDSER